MEAWVDVPIRSGGVLVEARVDDPIRPAGVVCLSWCGAVLVDVPIQPAGVTSCRFVAVGVVVLVCSVFGPSLTINRINSLLFINIRRTARFRIFQKKVVNVPNN